MNANGCRTRFVQTQIAQCAAIIAQYLTLMRCADLRIGELTMDELQRFCKDRDAALLSLNERKIRQFAKKYAIHIPENKTVFWAGVHKAILCLNNATEKQKRNSIIWLIEHGFSPDLG